MTTITGDSPAPVSESDRIDSLDVLRGFAVLGILSINIGSFAMPGAAYFDPTAWGNLTGANYWIWWVSHVLADLKFMAIFSMLFGAGILLMAERHESRGRPSSGLHYRRMAWLIVFGLMHAHLLWYGDILVWYGVTGLFIYLFRHRSPRTLITCAIISWIVGSSVMVAGGLSAPSWPPEVAAEIVGDLKPTAEVTAAEIAAYQGGWLQQMEHRVPAAVGMETETYLFWAVWRVSGLMLMGMALFKLGVFSAKSSARTYLTFIGLALLVGIPVISYGVARNFAIDWRAPDFFFLGSQFNYWGSILVALGWVSGVMLACRTPAFRSLTDRLAAVGRMAFTNYIMQTIICTWIFYGHGLGLFAQVERTTQTAVLLGVWAFQLIVSPIWLDRFHYGPLEWLWRSLVYTRRQRFRRSPSLRAAGV